MAVRRISSGSFVEVSSGKGRAELRAEALPLHRRARAATPVVDCYKTTGSASELIFCFRRSVRAIGATAGHSLAMRAPFAATERFIANASNATTSVKTATIQKQSK